MYDANPTIFVPVPGVDNGPAIRALLASGKRWIQINGSALRLDTPVLLEDDGVPADFVHIQPHPSIATVVVDPSGIGRDAGDPTNPSYAAFEYGGKRTTAGYLSALVAAGSRVLPVNNGALYAPGDWINVSNASTNPGATLLPLDGPGAKYRVEAVVGNNLTIDRPTERAHPNNATASKCKPLVGAIIEGLTFTGDCTVGIHIHDDINGTYRGIRTVGWTGRVGVLIDNWNIGSLIDDCFITGTTPGTGALESAWGVAIEGGSGSRYSQCGGTMCGTGITINYGYDVRGVDTLAFSNTVNVAQLTECVDCFNIRPRTANASALDVSESGSNVNCAVVDRRQATDVEMGTGDNTKAEWRSLTMGGQFAATESILACDENNGLRQVNPATALLALKVDGSMERENIWVDSPQNYGGNVQLSNNLQHWAIGMLSSDPFRDMVIYNVTAGQVDLRVAYDTGMITTRGDVNIGAGKALKINNVTMLTGRGAAIPNAAGGATVDVEARAALNALLAQLRLGTLPTT
ncbi:MULTISPECIES: hypothetical protein [unclassified Sphingopyxis]|uniref:hypothetical protein n=1 Tax=unclassified Sphingopyxis TaxID=2614943 RepID=UPI000731D14E|nr:MULTISPECIES: hypothetical protein [unclassified Sphingopyxis]KTE24444.1 hypothetical protein ATE61_13640 [Sphingopyxis sp. H057]KTE50972.1 hypothetical protein ATE69_17340 [Sphingopyxis sp. H071]KTE52115.1 hypothetical protein ATE64_11945 [Sphingopyxis sp. H073]KTE60552.1 hypothetical protein ATE66_08200 [Sphingopyxis sp. H107]KTE63859.1 hypothetical protein ATE65_13735 [Sphingopyxis sp. H100]